MSTTGAPRSVGGKKKCETWCICEGVNSPLDTLSLLITEEVQKRRPQTGASA